MENSLALGFFSSNLKNPFHSFNIFSIATCLIFYLDNAFTFMGFYFDKSWIHEQNQNLMMAIINKNVFFPFTFVIATSFFLFLTWYFWHREAPKHYDKLHYIFWGLLVWISFNTWMGWFGFLISG